MPKESSPSPAAAIQICILCIFIISGLSCSNEQVTFRLRCDREPVGQRVEYKLTSHRVGTVYKNDELDREIDLQVEADIIYTTKEILPNGDAIIHEKNRWSYDIQVDDSGQVKRKTKEFEYTLRVAPTGKVLDFEMIGEDSPTWIHYSRNYYEQGIPVFPEEEVTIGYSWIQTASVKLPDGPTEQVSTTYRIKGTVRKMGYDCAIIEYKGALVLPVMPDPDDTVSVRGVDRIEMNGILYYGYDAGMSISSEESRRVISDRLYDKEGEITQSKSEIDEIVSYNLVSIGSI